MTRRLLVLLAILAPSLLQAAPARAQVLNADELTVDVPFQFVVGDVMLPAGRYDVRAAADGPSVVWFASSNGAHTAVANTIWGGAVFDGRDAVLQFKVYGNTHFLSRIDIPGEGGRALSVTSEEVEQELVRVAEQRVAHGN